MGEEKGEKCPEEIVEELNDVDENKNTTLHFAAAKGDTDKIVSIIERKIHKIDTENYMGWTPLMMSVRNAKLEAVNLLLENGANSSKRNKFKSSILPMAVASGDIEIVTIVLNHLLSGGISKKSMQDVLSPLIVAIICKHSHVLSYLIDQGFDVNAAAKDTGITPLMVAAAMSSCKDQIILLKAGADESLKNNIGLTASDVTQMKLRQKPIMLSNKQNHQMQTPSILSNAVFFAPMVPCQNSGVTGKHMIPAPMVQSHMIHSPVIQGSMIQSPMIQIQSPMIQSPMIQSPMIQSPMIQSPMIQSPMVYHNQPPNFLLPANARVSKSSNIDSATYIQTPCMTPINHEFPHQMFFPPSFSPSQFVSPISVSTDGHFVYSNDVFNSRMCSGYSNSPCV